jgi:hypothetical protein
LERRKNDAVELKETGPCADPKDAIWSLRETVDFGRRPVTSCPRNVVQLGELESISCKNRAGTKDGDKPDTQSPYQSQSVNTGRTPASMRLSQ